MSAKIEGSLGVAATVAVAGLSRKAPVAKSGQEGSSTSRSDADTLQLTGNAMQLQDIHQAVSDSPGFDAKRVESLRSQIASGSYKVDEYSIASKLMSMDSSLSSAN